VYGIPVPGRSARSTDGSDLFYGIAKLAVEKYLALFRRLHDLPYIVLRAFDVYGPGKDPFGRQGAINVSSGTSSEASRSGSGDGEVVRDYIYIEDLLALFVRCIGTASATRRRCSTRDRGGALLAGHRRPDSRGHRTDPKVEWTAGRKADVPAKRSRHRKARERFDWTPEVPLDEGIRRTWDWIRSLPSPGPGAG